MWHGGRRPLLLNKELFGSHPRGPNNLGIIALQVAAAPRPLVPPIVA
jgi:hypothetical protein